MTIGANLAKNWHQVCANGESVALFFYSHLAVTRPDIRALFGVDMTTQRDRFVTAFGHIVASAHDVATIRPYLRRLGQAHADWGAQPEHYTALGTSLFATLAQFLGAAWTPAVARAWYEAYQRISEAMLDGAPAAEQPGLSA